MARVSIIVNNYNYELYLGAAIDSALSQTYPHCEVIVVDDGSSDGSRDIIESYGEQIQAVFKDNGGQASAFNAGFAVSSGEWILYLDADDLLDETALQQLIAHVESVDEAPAAVSFYLRNIDASGKLFEDGSQTPSRITPHGQLEETLKRGAYWYAPTTGNLFSRFFLQQILPMPEAEYRISADLYIQTVVPFLGKISVISEPALGFYRIHGQNNYCKGDDTIEQFNKQLLTHLENEKRKHSIIRFWANKLGLRMSRGWSCNSPGLIFRRMVASKKLGRGSPFPEDTWGELFWAQLRGLFSIRSIKGLKRHATLIFAGIILGLSAGERASKIGQRFL